MTLCALVMAHLQGNAPDELRALADACGVEYRAILAAVRRAPDYAREEGLPYTALTETPITPARAREAVAWGATPLPPQQLQ